MKKVLTSFVLVASFVVSPAHAGDPFSDGRANIDVLLGKRGAVEVRDKLLPNIDSALECFSVGTEALTVFASGQMPRDNATAFGLVLALSSSAADNYQRSMSLDQDTFLSLSKAAGQRVDAAPSVLIPNCINLTNEFLKAVIALPAS